MEISEESRARYDLPDLARSIQEREASIRQVLEDEAETNSDHQLTFMYKERRKMLYEQNRPNETKSEHGVGLCSEDKCKVCSTISEQVSKFKQTQVLLNKYFSQNPSYNQIVHEEEMQDIEILKHSPSTECGKNEKTTAKTFRVENLQGDSDPFMVECVECGTWVEASLHKDNIEVGYCCGNVLVSRID